MSNKFTHTPVSKKHIFWCSLVIGFIFTYVGVDENLLELITDFGFVISFILNVLQAYLLMLLAYHLNFSKKLNFWYALLVTLSIFYAYEFFSYLIFDYDTDDLTELYTSTLPFGTTLIFGFNLVYSLVNKPITGSSPEKENMIWLDTLTGRVKLEEDSISFAFLTEAYLEINTSQGTFKTFYSLKQLENLLIDKNSFFRLNKQYLCQKNSIKFYKPLPDGRLEIDISNHKKCVVSKNKASSFKKWIDES